MPNSWDLRLSAEVTFLGLTIWREARGEPYECQVGVGYSIMNRVLRPKWWGKTLLEVLFKKRQYSSLTDPKDAQLAKWPDPNDHSWWRCLEIARDVMLGLVLNPAPGADSYYDISIPPPKWADPKKFVCQMGRIRFYDLDDDYQGAHDG